MDILENVALFYGSMPSISDDEKNTRVLDAYWTLNWDYDGRQLEPHDRIDNLQGQIRFTPLATVGDVLSVTTQLLEKVAYGFSSFIFDLNSTPITCFLRVDCT